MTSTTTTTKQEVTSFTGHEGGTTTLTQTTRRTEIIQQNGGGDVALEPSLEFQVTLPPKDAVVWAPPNRNEENAKENRDPAAVDPSGAFRVNGNAPSSSTNKPWMWQPPTVTSSADAGEQQPNAVFDYSEQQQQQQQRENLDEPMPTRWAPKKQSPEHVVTNGNGGQEGIPAHFQRIITNVIEHESEAGINAPGLYTNKKSKFLGACSRSR